MVQLPNLVQEAPIVRMMNSVLVGTMKFTLDQFDAFFTAQNPAPTRLAAQLAEYRTGYNRLNSAYALTRESLLTGDITGLDKEGDTLYQGIKDTSEAAKRMTFLAARQEAGERLSLTVKKYKINTKENLISEWSKMQQLCEEINTSAQLTADIATVGLTEAMARLSAISDQLRDTLTQRSNELPSQKAMQQAREAMYPEYRALIDILNAYALVDADVTRFATLIQTLNRNIDYVRIHAMTGGGTGTGSGSDDNQSNQNNQNNQTEPGSGGETGGGETGGQQAGGETGGETGGTGGETGGTGGETGGGETGGQQTGGETGGETGGGGDNGGGGGTGGDTGGGGGGTPGDDELDG